MLIEHPKNNIHIVLYELGKLFLTKRDSTWLPPLAADCFSFNYNKIWDIIASINKEPIVIKLRLHAQIGLLLPIFLIHFLK